MLKITNCSDTMMWYRGFVGETFPVFGEEADYYISREKGGYVNIVKKCDAELIENEQEASDGI